MDEYTLTIPDMGRFRFHRTTEGGSFEGNWITLGRFGSMMANTVLPLALQDTLTEIARARGMIEPHHFARFPKVPKSEPMKVQREKKAPKDGLMHGFNPFAE